MIADTKTVLLATDFSQTAQRAFDAAIQLARTFDAVLHILHVNEEEAVFEGNDSEEIGVFLNDIQRRRADWMERFASSARDAGIEAVSVSKEGPPADVILAEANAVDAGIIVMGTQGLHGLGNMLPGSVARKVLRKSKRPVMVVSRLAGVAPAGTDATFENIIYPTDFSEASRSGLSACMPFLDKTDARLTLVNILRMPRMIPLLPGEAMVSVPYKAVDHLTEKLEKQMSELEASLGREKISSEIGVHADPAQGIAEIAAHAGVDLIIIPRHSSHGIGEYFFGSTAERLVKEAPVPVLVFSPSEER